MLTSSGHLTYCTNIHSGETWQDHFAALQVHFPGIKARLSPDKPMGIGLRLSNIASIALSKDENLQAFKQWLADNDAYVFTMNGFPYGDFHQTRVKDQVHAPDWTTPDRLNYTLRLFEILSHLLPGDMDGGISTSPLSYRYWFASADDLEAAKKEATTNILKIAEYLIAISTSTGKLLHLDIEPEPDGILESGQEFIDWYEDYLLPVGTPIFAERYSVTPEESALLIKAHIRLCYDVCHFAIGYEPHAEMIDSLQEKGIKIGKIQISAALKALINKETNARSKTAAAFEKFNEPVYLHQVVARTNGNDLLRYRDLPEALMDASNPSVIEWRAHFHVPVFEKDFGLLQSTQDDIVEVLELHKKQPFTNHLEVETYTWEVLSEELKVPLPKSIIREMEWVIGKLGE
ncbi:MAG: metabolite traffic protein EboE [Chitinophagaceae bacterium]